MTRTFLLASSYVPKINADSTMGERIAMGLETLLFGMLVIFAVLALIWGILELFHLAFHGADKSKKAPAKKKEAPVPPPAPITPAPAPVSVNASDDSAVIAAITAALAVVLQQPTTSFRVVSFKRTNKNTPWNQKNL